MKKPRSRLASLTLLDIAAGVAVTAVAVPALAADMPTKAPAAIVAPAYNWTGFYLGAHAGYRWADADFTSSAYVFDPASGPVTLPARRENYGLNGGIVGLQGGYNYQFAPQWLIGIEGDWSWGNGSDTKNALITGVDSTGSDGFTLAVHSETKLTWQATARARLGYVAGQWLLYATGGAAWTHVKWSDAQTLTTTGPLTVNTASWSSNKTLTGWVVGGGFEYMFNPNWIGRVEYLYESFGDFTVPHGFNPQLGNLDLSAVQKVRVGISYKFGH
jgi:outer membrane immunogenic protein